MGAADVRHRCQSCHAEVVWCMTVDGNRMPVDAIPVPGATVRVVNDGGIRRALVVGDTIDMFDSTDDGVRYVSHFATCPDAASWRAS